MSAVDRFHSAYSHFTLISLKAIILSALYERATLLFINASYLLCCMKEAGEGVYCKSVRGNFVELNNFIR